MASVTASQARLADVKTPVVRVHIDDDTFQDQLLGVLSKAAFGAVAKLEGFTDLTTTNVEATLVEQGINVTMDFGFTWPQHDIKLSGSLVGQAGVDMDAKNVNFRIAFQQARLDTLSDTDEKRLIADLGYDAAIGAVELLLKNFIKNFNGALLTSPAQAELPIPQLDPVSVSRSIQKDGTKVTIHANKRITVPLTYDRSAILVTPDGATLLAAPGKAPKHDEVKPTPTTQAAFDTAYAAFQKAFGALEKKTFGDVSGDTSAMVTRAYMQDAFNTATHHLRASIAASNFVHLKPSDRTFDTEVRVNLKKKLPQCDSIRTPFTGGKDCSPKCDLQDCSARCQQSSRFKRGVCIAECEVGRAAELAECGACKAANKAKEVAHKAADDGRVAICETKREALQLTDKLLDFGRLSGRFTIPATSASANLRRLRASDNFSRVSVDFDAAASANANLSVTFAPKGLGHVACIFKLTKSLSFQGSFKASRRTLEARISGRRVGSDLELAFTLRPPGLDIAIKPVPYDALVSDPRFALDCTVIALALPVIGGGELLSKGALPGPLRAALEGIYPLQLGPKTFRVRLKPIVLKDLNNLTLSPRLTSGVFEFVAE